MIRYLTITAAAFALLSSAAFAETTVIRTSPSYVAASPHKTTVVKKRVDRYGRLVTVKKTTRNGYSGSSVNRTRTVTNPYTGVTTRTRTTVR